VTPSPLGVTSTRRLCDVIELNCHDLRQRPIEQRTRSLADAVRGPHLGAVLNEHYQGDGQIVFGRARKLGRERIVVKATYRSDRCSHWIKVKNPAAPAVTRQAEVDWDNRQSPGLEQMGDPRAHLAAFQRSTNRHDLPLGDSLVFNNFAGTLHMLPGEAPLLPSRRPIWCGLRADLLELGKLGLSSRPGTAHFARDCHVGSYLPDPWQPLRRCL
jgi:hypothetical protein